MLLICPHWVWNEEGLDYLAELWAGRWLVTTTHSGTHMIDPKDYFIGYQYFFILFKRMWWYQ